MPGSPKRTRPDCPYSASQLELINLQDDRIALGLGILCEVEIVQLTSQELSDTIEIYRRYVHDANLRAHCEGEDNEIESLYQDGSIPSAEIPDVSWARFEAAEDHGDA